ncbi:MAG: hypothetical protein WCF31_08270, partial [Candidatus Deferrimicrobiaceae bacterium]
MTIRIRRLPWWVSAIVAIILLAGCSGTNDASLSVRLTYPQDGSAAVSSAPTADPAALAAGAGEARPTYLKNPDNRILVRVLAPHIPAPIEVWFDRSQGRGKISGIPPGDRIAVEVDEYDNTALTLGTNAPLLGRGFAHGVALAAGESRTVAVPMYDKGTIVRVSGAPPSGGAGTAGDTGDGGLAIDAQLGQPLAVEVGPDDSVYVSSAQFNRIRRIDRYGYISHYAGSGPSGTLTEGESAAAAPIGPAYDLDMGPSGDLYLISWDQQILRVDRATGAISIRYDGQKGIFNPAAKPDLAVVDDDAIYYTNGMENRVYLVSGGVRSDYVMDNTPYQTQEGADKDFYPLRYPASVTFHPSGPFLFFSDRENNQIKLVSMGVNKIYTKVGSSTVMPFSDGMDPLTMTPVLPLQFDRDLLFGNFFLREKDFHGIRVLRPGNQVFNFAGTGTAGYAGDEGPATSAQLNDPLSVAVDSRGNVYIADTGNHAIRMVLG